MGILNVSITVSESDAAIKFARFSSSTKSKILHHFSPLLALLQEHLPTPPHQLTRLPPGTLWHNSPRRLFLNHNLNRRFEYNRGLDGADTATPMHESATTKGDETSSKTNFDMPERTTWLLHGGYIFSFIETSWLLISSLIIFVWQKWC